MAIFSRRSRGQITAADLANYGSVTDKTVDVDAAAKDLGVSKRRVQEAIRQANLDQRNTFFRRMTGRADADVSGTGSMRGMLQAAFGRGPRGGVVDTKAAAQALGVSRGTVRRWAAGTQQPKPAHLKTVEASARRAASTKAGRRAGTAAFRTSTQGRTALRTGSTVWIRGVHGPSGYERDREVSGRPLGPEQLDALLQAYEERGEEGLIAELTGFMSDYVADWNFLTIEDFNFGPPE